MAKIDKENMMAQAQNVWTMLDDMAQSDPQAYKKFIDKQLKEGREYMRLPDPHMCVRASYSDSKNKDSGTIYINMCEWARVPKPPDDDAPIPVIGGSMCMLEENGTACKLVSLGFNPKVLEDYGIDASNLHAQRDLIHLAIDFAKNHYKLDIPYSYTLFPKDTKHKGTLETLRDSLKSKVRKEDEAHEQQMKELSESFAPVADRNVAGDSLLSQLSNLTTDGDSPAQSKASSEHVLPNLTLNGSSSEKRAPKKNLIQEIGSVETEESGKPSYSVSVKEAEGTKKRRVVVKIELPKVLSVGECVLDIEQKKLVLSVPDKYDDLDVTFAEPVWCDDSSAKFSKKSSTLTVIVPTVHT